MSANYISISRRDLLAAGTVLAASACARPRCLVVPLAPPAPRPANAMPPAPYEEDFDSLWAFCRDTYCFFDEKASDWDRVRDVYRPRASAATTPDQLAEVLDDALAELYDPHCHVQGSDRDGARRFIPYDLWAEMRDARAIVTALRPGSPASDAKLRAGDEVIMLDGAPIADAVRAQMPRCLARRDVEAEAWALLAALAGRRMKPRALVVRSSGSEPREVLLAASASTGNASSRPAVEGRREGKFGYIRIATFGESSIVGTFDQLLEELRGAPGLILDVRANGGGDTAYARPIMGRFVKSRTPYAWMARRERGARALGAPWREYVDPRSPFTYEGKIVVLVDRFSASMAEGFPMGMRGIGRAKVVGTKMAGLGAAITTTTLRRSKLDVQISAEPVYDVNRQPRWRMVPDVMVRLEDLIPNGADDPILKAGIAVLDG